MAIVRNIGGEPPTAEDHASVQTRREAVRNQESGLTNAGATRRHGAGPATEAEMRTGARRASKYTAETAPYPVPRTHGK